MLAWYSSWTQWVASVATIDFCGYKTSDKMNGGKCKIRAPHAAFFPYCSHPPASAWSSSLHSSVQSEFSVHRGCLILFFLATLSLCCSVGAWAQQLQPPGLITSTAYRILVPWQGIEPLSPDWKADSQPLDHQGSPYVVTSLDTYFPFVSVISPELILEIRVDFGS